MDKMMSIQQNCALQDFFNACFGLLIGVLSHQKIIRNLNKIWGI
jgi:hypothetical protein